MIPLTDLMLLIGIVGGLAIGLAVGGLVLLRALRGRSISVMFAVVAVLTVLASLTGVLVTALAMFISVHDRTVAVILVVVAGLIGLLVALLLGRHVVRGSRELRAAVRSVGAGGFAAPNVTLPAELAELARELESAHLRLSESRAREQALETSRRELVAWVSHDLRTPLAGLRAMAEALEDGVVRDPETVARYHATMRREVDRLTGLVDDLFELARIQSGTLRLSRERVGLGDVLNDALASVEPLASAKRVRIGGRWPMLPVDVDAAEIGRAFRNIVVNAVRHTPSEGAIEVTGGVEHEMAWVTVSDGCGGIPEEDLPRVFDLAFRGSAARTPGPEGGAGLGLAIARGIVEAHAGQVRVANAGPGCRFVVRLPLAPPVRS